MERKLFTILIICMIQACETAPRGPAIINTANPSEQTPPAPATVQTVEKLTYKVGPFSLDAGQKAINMWEAPGSINFQTNEAVWITSFETGITGAEGEELPDNLLHLAILSNGSEKNPLCTEKEAPNPFFAATSVVKEVQLPDGTGYPVLPEDRLDAKVILQNPNAQKFTNVFFTFTLTAVPMKVAKNLKDVAPYLLDIDPCDHLPITVPPKEFVKREASFIIPEDGLLTRAYGLLQDYGVGASLTSNGSPTPFWEGNAELSKDHKILSMPFFEDPAGLPIKSGDEISMSVAYDNISNIWQGSSTGAIMAYMTRIEVEKVDAQKMLLTQSPSN